MTLRSALPLLIVCLLGCASDPPPPSDPDVAVGDDDAPFVAADAVDAQAKPKAPTVAKDPSVRALQQEARSVGDPQAWPSDLVQHADPVVRARVARSMGRVRDARLVPTLTALPRDPSDAVERERLFALGQIAAAAAADHVKDRLGDEQAAVRASAVQALAKLGRPELAEAVVPLLEDADAAVRGEAALALVRLRGRRVKPPAPFSADDGSRVNARLRRLLDDPDVEVVWRATYALANLELPRKLPTLEAALRHEDERVKLFALRGIGREKEALRRRLDTVSHALQEAMKSGHVQAATTAAQVLASLGSANAIPYLAWAAGDGHTAEESRLGARSHHLRTAALRGLTKLAGELAEAKTLDAHGRKVSEDALRGGLKAKSLSVRTAALVGLAKLDPQGSVDTVIAAASKTSAYERMAAASAAPSLPRETAVDLLTQLMSDSDPRVVCAALDGLGSLKEQSKPIRAAARHALEQADMAVRTTGLTLLQEHGRLEDLEAIAAALAEVPGDANDEVRVEGMKAFAAIGKQHPNAAADYLRKWSSDGSAAVREAAAKGFKELTGEELSISDPGPEQPPNVSLESGDVRSSARNPRLVLHTNRGKLVLELFREDAPYHVKSIVERARAKKHDGLVFHRVVSVFVIQGLDPRGDGWGKGGVFLRDEINQRRYIRGALGMPNSGPDTAGCQIFVTHVPTPHLDGRYTVFGQVIEGWDVLDTIELGDVCERAEVLD